MPRNQPMSELRYSLIIQSSQMGDCVQLAQNVAAILPSARWVQNTPEIELGDLDFPAIETAIYLEGGGKWKIRDHRVPVLNTSSNEGGAD
jgi:hypothetical protein